MKSGATRSVTGFPLHGLLPHGVGDTVGVRVHNGGAVRIGERIVLPVVRLIALQHFICGVDDNFQIMIRQDDEPTELRSCIQAGDVIEGFTGTDVNGEQGDTHTEHELVDGHDTVAITNPRRILRRPVHRWPRAAQSRLPQRTAFEVRLATGDDMHRFFPSNTPRSVCEGARFCQGRI